MKKLILFSLVLMLSVSFFSCKKNEIKETEKSEQKVDLDWSKMNYNMLSSVVFDILINPDEYAGKKIKVSGNYYTSLHEGKRYFSVLVWDATGCCPAGLDFIPPEGLSYPEDFPKDDEKITVTGTLDYPDNNSQDNLVFIADEIIKKGF